MDVDAWADDEAALVVGFKLSTSIVTRPPPDSSDVQEDPSSQTR